MLGNYIQETVSAPGTGASVNLAGAPTGRVTFASKFATGALVFYGMDDGTQSETGYGTFTAGSPNTFSRDTVLWNSAGTTARLNFAGTTKIFNDVPAERSVYANAVNSVALPGGLSFGSVAVSSNTDLSKHIALYGNIYGFSITNASLNYVAYAGAAHTFIVGGTTVGSIGPTAATFNQSIINYTGTSGGLIVNYNANQAAGVAITQTSTTVSGFGLISSVWLTTSLLCLWEYQGASVGSVTTNGSSASYNTTSDHRLKVLHGAADASAFFGKLPVYDAEMKFGQPRPMFLAHEVATVFPDAVRGEKDGMQPALDFEGAPRLDINGDPYEVPLHQTVDHLMLIPAMWAMIDALNARLAVLEGRPK